MAGSLNRVTLIGNLGKDPEVRAMQDGREVVNLTVATSESWKDKNTGERKTKTEWHRAVIFNEHLIKVAKDYLHKGSKLLIEGQLQTRQWVNKEGADQYTTEIVLQNFNGCVVLLDSRHDNASSSEETTASAENLEETLQDEVPY